MPSQLEEQGMGEEEALGLFMCLELPSACRGAGGQAGAFCVQELLGSVVLRRWQGRSSPWAVELLGSEVLRRWQGRSSPWAVKLLVLSLGAQHKGTCLAPAPPEKTDTRRELLSDALCHLPTLANLQCAVQSERLDKTQRFS